MLVLQSFRKHMIKSVKVEVNKDSDRLAIPGGITKLWMLLLSGH
jgi:hypothetical protein